MKPKSTLILVVLMAIMPIMSQAAAKSGVGSGTNPIGVAVSVGDGAIVQDGTVLSVASTTPDRASDGPNELLQGYEAEMAAIAQKFSATLAAITQAVERGQLTSEQGQKFSAEQYEIAEMQLELLSAWRVMLEEEPARLPVPAAGGTPASVQEDEIVTVALPFLPFQLNSSLAEYLKLSKPQAEAIEQVMISERAKIDPLMAQLRTAREKLLAAGLERTNDKEIKALAEQQAGLLTKLIVANAHMQGKVYKLLSPEQQRKLDDYIRRSDPITSR